MFLNQLTDEIYNVLPSTSQSVTRIISPDGQIVDQARYGDVDKAQIIRIVDVMVLGPAMLYAGLGKTLPEGLKTLMVLTGIGTIIYNGYNYFENEKLREK